MSDMRYRNNYIGGPGDLTWTPGTTSGANALTVVIPAAGPGVKTILKRVIGDLGVTGAQPPVTVTVFDGTTAGAVKGTYVLTPAASGGAPLDRDDLDIVGSAATPMTVVMAAPAAGSVQSLNIQSYQSPKTSSN